MLGGAQALLDHVLDGNLEHRGVGRVAAKLARASIVSFLQRSMHRTVRTTIFRSTRSEHCDAGRSE